MFDSSIRSYAQRLRDHAYDEPDRNRMLTHYCAFGTCRSKIVLQVDGCDAMQVCYLHTPAGMLLLLRENPYSVVSPDFSRLDFH